MGFVVLGIFAFTNVALQGAVFLMIAHGISTGALFLLVGMLYERRHTFEISEFGGLATPMPRYAAFFLFAVLSSLGLPLLNGFVGEFLVLIGTYQAHWEWASWAATGVILSACYLLWAYQRVFFGELTHSKNRDLLDVNPREKWVLVAMCFCMVWLGVHTRFFTHRFAGSCQEILLQMNRNVMHEVALPGAVRHPARSAALNSLAISAERLRPR
jgi:NADH-quinone oxidoreductase subunit M